jgi:hypothetical protein
VHRYASARALTLDEARKAAMTNYAHSLAAALKTNACSWEAGPAYTPIGPGDSPAAAYSRCMDEGSHMSRELKRCLIGIGVGVATAVGGTIGVLASRAFAQAVVANGAGGCLAAIAL